MSIQTQTTSFKAECWQAIHNLLTDTLKIALYTGSASLDASTTTYTATNEITGTALGLLAANHERDVLKCIGIKAPGAGDRRVRILEDIAILTGGRLVAEDAGDQMESAGREVIGRARRVWCNRDFFSVVGGAGDQGAIRSRISGATNSGRAAYSG